MIQYDTIRYKYEYEYEYIQNLLHLFMSLYTQETKTNKTQYHHPYIIYEKKRNEKKYIKYLLKKKH